jgi:hypothetical protein
VAVESIDKFVRRRLMNYERLKKGVVSLILMVVFILFGSRQ